MLIDEQKQLTNHLENIASSLGSAIYGLIYPGSGSLERLWKDFGKSVADFIIWVDNDEPN